jgi:hypothetical protein
MTKIYSMKNKHPERQPQKAISSGCSLQRYFSSSLLLVIHKRLVLTPASCHWDHSPSFFSIFAQYGIPCRRICALLLRCPSGASSPYTCKTLCCFTAGSVFSAFGFPPARAVSYQRPAPFRARCSRRFCSPASHRGC